MPKLTLRMEHPESGCLLKFCARGASLSRRPQGVSGVGCYAETALPSYFVPLYSACLISRSLIQARAPKRSGLLVQLLNADCTLQSPRQLKKQQPRGSLTPDQLNQNSCGEMEGEETL